MSLHHFSIENLDLEPIMVKAIDPEEGYGWDLAFTKKVSDEYKKYLTLCLENEDFPLVPSTFVDDFWHLHILDTLKYQEDCQNIFGYFLHHFPYFGMRGEEDAENLKAAWNETRHMYENRFGEIDDSLWPVSKRCPNCGKRCRDIKGFAKEERPRLSAA